ncbi:MAG: alpha/beta fold hydrolase, partial [Dichotomicrobium sp.]
HETVLCWNMVVSPEIRGALVAREVSSDEVLATLDTPVLMSHGQDDTVILPAMGEHIVSTCPNASASWYPETGHAPFLENAGRFNEELSRFVRHAQYRSSTA